MRNVGGQPYLCADCNYQSLDWDRIDSHAWKVHKRAPHCGPDAQITPENIYIGAVLQNNETGERVRVLEILDREQLRLKVQLLSPADRTVIEWDGQEWLLN